MLPETWQTNTWYFSPTETDRRQEAFLHVEELPPLYPSQLHTSYSFFFKSAYVILIVLNRVRKLSVSFTFRKKNREKTDTLHSLVIQIRDKTLVPPTIENWGFGSENEQSDSSMTSVVCASDGRRETTDWRTRTDVGQSSLTFCYYILIRCWS